MNQRPIDTREPNAFQDAGTEPPPATVPLVRPPQKKVTPWAVIIGAALAIGLAVVVVTGLVLAFFALR